MNVPAVLPASLDGWTITKTVLWGERRWTCRHSGTTLHIIQLRPDLWDLTRYRGGRIEATTTTNELPPEIRAALEAA